MKVVFKLVAVATLAATAAPARADRRAFTFTYEYPTQPEGNLELELWNTQTRDGLGDDGGVSTAEQQLEIEYGLTDRTSVSIYQAVAQGAGEGLHYAETKLEVRHRLAERGEWPVDLSLYGEIAKPYGEAAIDVEPKVIIARDFGAVTFAANLIGELEFDRVRGASGNKNIDTAFVPGWAAGLTYEVRPQLKVGAETWGAIETPFDTAATYAWAGPAVSWAPSTRFWVAATAGFGLNARSADLVARFVLSVGL